MLWKSPRRFSWSVCEWMRDVGETNLKLLLHRPSAIPRLEDLCGSGWKARSCRDGYVTGHKQDNRLRNPHRRWMFVFTALHLSADLMPPLFFASDDRFTLSHSSPFALWKTTHSEITTVHIVSQHLRKSTAYALSCLLDNTIPSVREALIGVRTERRGFIIPIFVEESSHDCTKILE